MKNNFIHVCFVIDESSSMWSSVNDVKGGFQRIIDEQKANKEGTCAISVFKFATRVYEPDFVMKDIREVENQLNYEPSGCTALYDGVGTAIDKVGQVLRDMPEWERPEKNLIVIMTDGEENVSREYQPSQIREMIKHQEDKYNWTFLYIGTDISNTNDADRIGVTSRFVTTRGKMSKAYDAVNTVTSCYRNTLGDSVTKGFAVMDCLSETAATLNTEYLADTGISIDNA